MVVENSLFKLVKVIQVQSLITTDGDGYNLSFVRTVDGSSETLLGIPVTDEDIQTFIDQLESCWIKRTKDIGGIQKVQLDIMQQLLIPMIISIVLVILELLFRR